MNAQVLSPAPAPTAAAAGFEASLAKAPGNPAPRPQLHGPFFLVVNPRASGYRPESLQEVCALLQAEGRAHHVMEARQGLAATAALAAQRAQQQGGSVIAAGGDGSVNTVGAAAWRASRPFGVLPLGRCNRYALAQGLPVEPLTAARAWLSDSALALPIGLANDRPFFLHAGLGAPAAAWLRPCRAQRLKAGSVSDGLRRLMGSESPLCRLRRRLRARRHFRLLADGERLAVHSPILLVTTEGAAGELLLALPMRGVPPRFQQLRVWPLALQRGQRPAPMPLELDGEAQGGVEHLHVQVAERSLLLLGGCDTRAANADSSYTPGVAA